MIPRAATPILSCFVSIASTCLVLIASSVSAAQRPLVVNDIFKQEAYGRGLIDPTNRWLVYERIPGYILDYSLTREYEFGEIQAVDLTTAAGEPEPLFPGRADTLYHLIGFSPSGEYLALYASRYGEESLAILDVRSRRLQSVSGTPRWADALLWISDHELVYTRINPSYSRRWMGAQLVERWNQSWKGESSVTEVNSHAIGGQKRWVPGELIRVNAQSGQTEVLAPGSLISMKVSTDARWLTGLREQVPAQRPVDQPVLASEFFYPQQPFVFDLSRKQYVDRLPEKLQVEWRDSPDSVRRKRMWFKPPSPTSTLMAESPTVALYKESTEDGNKLWLLSRNGKVRRIAQINQFLSSIARPQISTITYAVHNTAQGDVELTSQLLLPNGYDPQKRYPVVVHTYPECSEDCAEAAIGSQVRVFYTLELLAAKGYIVFYPQTNVKLTRGADGPLTGLANIVMQGVNALAAKGLSDPSRSNLIGHSQGGLTSLWLATQTDDQFRAVVSSNGWSNLLTHYFRRYTYQVGLTNDTVPSYQFFRRYEGGDAGMVGLGSTPWQNPDIYIRNSPVFQADKIKAPILLVHTDMDELPVEQYEEMFMALYRLRKEATLVRYWGDAHGPSSPGNIRDFWYRTFAWFDRWSDISRDARGNMQWDGNVVRSRNGAPVLAPSDFERFEEL